MARNSQADEIARLQRQIAAQQHLLDKVRAFSSLQIVVHNAPVPIERLAVEFYYAVTDVLEGKKAEELNLTLIDKQEFMKVLLDE